MKMATQIHMTRSYSGVLNILADHLSRNMIQTRVDTEQLNSSISVCIVVENHQYIFYLLDSEVRTQ